MMKYFSKNQSLLQALFRMLFIPFAICSLALTDIVRANDDLNLSFTLTEVKGQTDGGEEKLARCLIVFSDPAKVGYKNAFCKYDNDKMDSSDGNIIAKLPRKSIFELQPYKKDVFEKTILTWLLIHTDIKKDDKENAIKATDENKTWDKFLTRVTKYLLEKESDNTVSYPVIATAKNEKKNITLNQIVSNIPVLNGLPNTVTDETFSFLVHQSIVYHFSKSQTDEDELVKTTRIAEGESSPPGPDKSIDEVKKEIQKVSQEVQTGLKNIREELQQVDSGKIFSLSAFHFLAVMLIVITILIFAIVIISLWKLKGVLVDELSRHINDKSGVVTGQMAKTVSFEKLFSSLSGKLENILRQRLDGIVKEVSSETKLTQQLKSIESSLGFIEKSIKGVKDLKWWEDNLPTLKKGVEITEIYHLNQELMKTKQAHETLQIDLKKERENLTKMSGECDAFEKEKTELSTKVETLEGEKTDLQKQLSELDCQKDEFETQFKNEEKSHSKTKESHKKEMRTFEEKVETLLRERFCLLKPKEVNLDDWMAQLERQRGTWQWLQVALAVTLSKCEKVNNEMELQEKIPISKPIKVLNVIELDKLLGGCRTLTTEAFTSDEELRKRLMVLNNGEWLQGLLKADALFSTYFGGDDYQSLKPLFAELSLISSLLETVLRMQGVEFYKPSLLELEPSWGSQVKIAIDKSSLSREFKEMVKEQVKQQQVKQGEGEMIVWVSKYGIKENQSSELAELSVIKYNPADWQ